MKQFFIISVGALFLLFTSSAEAATLGGIDPSIEKLNALETRQGTYLLQIFIRKRSMDSMNLGKTYNIAISIHYFHFTTYFQNP